MPHSERCWLEPTFSGENGVSAPRGTQEGTLGVARTWSFLGENGVSSPLSSEEGMLAVGRTVLSSRKCCLVAPTLKYQP